MYEDGSPRRYTASYDNPYWTVNKNKLTDNVDRILGYAMLVYNPSASLNITYRFGEDIYFDRRSGHMAIYSANAPDGQQEEDHHYNNNLNSDLTLNYSKELFQFFSANITLGQNMFQSINQQLYNQGNTYVIPDFYHMSNTSSQLVRENTTKYRTAALYADFQFSYRSMLFLGLTGRNEWSTTLPRENNSFFFPSASLGFIFSELPFLKNNDFLSYGKIRASYAQIANHATPYNVINTYTSATIIDGWATGDSFPFLGIPGFTPFNVLANSNLKPESLLSREIGLELKLLQNRLGFDITYYNNQNRDLLIQVPVAGTSGYNARYMNAATMENKGIEITAGVAKVLMAYLLGVTTDHWGDIPYSDAFKGAEGDCTAEYDTQEEIYATIFSLLNEAIADLNAPESLFSPGAEDLIYGGDLDKWEKTAYALKARYSLHLEKRKGSSALTDALNAVTKAYTGNADNMRVPFGSAYNNSNPMYQYESERTGYYSANTTFINLLDATGDPRKAVYFSGDEGSPSGEPNLNAASIGSGYASTDSPIDLVSFSELKFIEAEARYKLNSADPLAVEACNEGIKASLMREGVYGDGSWFNAHKINASSLSLETIIIQKYLSSFLQVETWTDWRRTGYPVLSLAKGAVLSQIPRRYPYCDEERLYNGENMPAGLTITDRVWWDIAK